MIIGRSPLRRGLFSMSRKTSISHLISNTTIIRNFFSNQLPKGSNFSNFMGLYKELQTVRKQQMKEQKSKTNLSSAIIIISMVMLGGYFFICLNDKNYKTLLELAFIKLKSNIQTSSKKRPQIIKQGLTKIMSFLSEDPYNYSIVLDNINYYGQILRKARELELVNLVNDCYQMIVKHNQKAESNTKLVEGIANLIEISILTKNNASLDLIRVLLSNGSIQHVFLALRYLQRIQNLEEICIHDCKLKQKIRQNLMAKYNKDSEYYKQIWKSKDDDQFPPIAFKRSEERRWLSYIQDKLSITFE